MLILSVVEKRRRSRRYAATARQDPGRVITLMIQNNRFYGNFCKYQAAGEYIFIQLR